MYVQGHIHHGEVLEHQCMVVRSQYVAAAVCFLFYCGKKSYFPVIEQAFKMKMEGNQVKQHHHLINHNQNLTYCIEWHK